MCGIAGFFRKNDDAKMEPEKLIEMFSSLQLRGTDAAGWAWAKPNGRVAITKSRGSAEKILKMPKADLFIKDAARSKWALFHCRAATNGTKFDNRNNHPLYTNKAVIVHNGVIHSGKNIKTLGDCDSELIGRLIDEVGMIEAITYIGGSIATAFHLFEEPDSFYLYRESNPIEYAEDDDFFVFASMSLTLKKLGFDKSKSLDTYTLFKVDSQGLTTVQKFVSTSTPVGHNFNHNYHQGGYYFDRTQGDRSGFPYTPFTDDETDAGMSYLNRQAASVKPPKGYIIVSAQRYTKLKIAGKESKDADEILCENHITLFGTFSFDRQTFKSSSNKDYMVNMRSSFVFEIKKEETTPITP